MTYGEASALALIALCLLTLRALPNLREVLPVVPARTAWAGVAVLALHFLLVWSLAPFDTWHSNRHGLGYLVAVEHGSLAATSGLSALHGAGTYVALVLGRRLSLGLLSVFEIQLCWSLLATIAMGLWVTLATRDPSRGVLAALVLTVLPVRIRMGTTDCMYVVPEATWLLGLGLLTAWSRRREDTLLLGLGAGWITYTAHCRAEYMILAPLSVLVATSAVPGTLRALVLDRRAWLFAAAAGLTYLPRASHLLNADGQGGVAMVSDGERGASDTLLTNVRDPHLWPLYLALLLALSRRKWPASPPRDLLLGICTLAAVLPWSAPDAFDGTEVVLSRPLAWMGELHALVDAGLTPLPLILLALFGVARAAVRADPTGLAVIVQVVVSLWIYLPRWDNEATFVRVGLGGAWCFAWLVQSVLGPWWTRLEVRDWGRALWILALLVLPVGRYAGWVAYRFPMQQERALLDEARALIAAGGVVHLLHAGEVPAAWRTVLHEMEPRREPEGYLGAGQPHGVRPLSEPTTAGAEHYYLRSLDCFVPLIAEEGDCPEHCTWLYGVGDRLYQGPPPRYEGNRLTGTLIGLAPSWSLDEQVPCWTRPELATCGRPTADGVGCERWICPPDTPEPPPTPYLDPACAAFEATHVMEPITELPLAKGQLSGTKLTPVPHGAVLGLYHVIDRKEAP
jgi:hypothetical protein